MPFVGYDPQREAVAVERIVFYPERIRRSYLGAPFTPALPPSVMMVGESK